jgi:hypothetical protein
VQPGWRDSRTFVEELDWRRQMEHAMWKQTTDAFADGGSDDSPKQPAKQFAKQR